MSKKDEIFLSTTHRTIADIERIGDYSENITEYAANLKNRDASFSEMAMKEVSDLTEIVNALYEQTMNCYENDNNNSFMIAMNLEDQIDELTKQMTDNHIERLNNGQCTAAAGAQFIKLANDVERIGDHLINLIDHDYKTSH